MPLAAAKAQFKTTLQTIFSFLGTSEPYPTAAQKAQQVATAVHTLLLQGVPQTQDVGSAAPGQAVVTFVTTTPSPVTGTGTGGLDQPTPGIGLDAARSLFVTQMLSSFMNYTGKTPDTAAGEWADALVALYQQAKVMTQVTGVFAPGAAVAGFPVGTVAAGSWSGSGVGSIESTSGSGLVLSSLSDAIEAVFGNVGSSKTAAEAAGDVADAVIDFAKTAAITTTDAGTAGGGLATVTPPVPPGYPGGDGVTTTPSPIISGTGSGALI